jgi:fucose 4-O-acetylase-like acetyltransferase
MRDPVFDVMKGIGIILMLIGHIPPGDQVYHVIYSFHMPLFFLIAGGFAKFECDWKGLVVKDVKRLLLPVFVTMAFIIVLSPLCFFINGNYNCVIAQLLSLLWLGDAFNTKW